MRLIVTIQISNSNVNKGLRRSPRLNRKNDDRREKHGPSIHQELIEKYKYKSPELKKKQKVIPKKPKKRPKKIQQIDVNQCKKQKICKPKVRIRKQTPPWKPRLNDSDTVQRTRREFRSTVATNLINKYKQPKKVRKPKRKGNLKKIASNEAAISFCKSEVTPPKRRSPRKRKRDIRQCGTDNPFAEPERRKLEDKTDMIKSSKEQNIASLIAPAVEVKSPVEIKSKRTFSKMIQTSMIEDTLRTLRAKSKIQ
ncbi:uncharacterized protein LOC119678840 [Teleopsis dalmanni]|uniref:uncharacterized protein LOC119678840 n=1 Tax=Teleopsis dalmanni TaxID=139649 RepID=UPI0018CD2F7D|nr:uncharacterized protein LOC119678840 [Teleopsis dalmanni]XP_037946833.1 uncharacterized protein LOC119678840 [Teleopsis dalmanni]XP_037946834.1 uncharacterized protein LOC119678840 [Teleopsis dalmanni]XP_037946835.1 uncharacterized protein LOC119678840 [Teleopsis dalmanni]